MSKKEKIKLELDIIKALILACLTAIFGIFSYCVINYKKYRLTARNLRCSGACDTFCDFIYPCTNHYQRFKQNRGVVNDRHHHRNVCVANAFCVCFDDCKNAR